MQTRQRGLAAHFHDLYLAHHRVALYVLTQPDQAVSHGEHRVGVGRREVLADQEGGGLPARHQHPQLLDKLLQVAVGAVPGRLGLDHRTERVDKHQRRIVAGDLFDDAAQHPAQITGHRVLGQADEAHAVVDRCAVKKLELLLVAQHLERRLAQHREIECRPLGRGQRKHDLVRERGLAAARKPGDQVERELGQATAQQLIQAKYTGGQLVDLDFGVHQASLLLRKAMVLSRAAGAAHWELE